MQSHLHKFLSLFFLLTFYTEASAAILTGTKSSNVELLAVSSGQASVTTDGTTSFSLNAPTTKARLYFIEAGSTLAGPVIIGVRYRGVYFTYLQARDSGICALPGTTLVMGLITQASSLDIGKVTYLSSQGFGYLNSLLSKASYDASTVIPIGTTTSCSPSATGRNLGLLYKAQRLSLERKNYLMRLKLRGDDRDNDGLIDRLDIDQNNDGVINSYDPNTNSNSSLTKFSVFPSLRLDIDQSLNAYTQELTEEVLNNAASRLGLAFQIAGAPSNTVELNCGDISYCSEGGSGIYDGKSFPDEYDSDTDGFGLITGNSSNLFQMSPNLLTTSEISPGNFFIETISNGSSLVAQYPSILSYVFATSPSIASIVMSGQKFAPTYPAQSLILGSLANPFISPVGWDGKLGLTAYRPQRSGLRASGESTYMDVGNSLIAINIPNGPCAGSGACSTVGPGNCRTATYSRLSTQLGKSNGILIDRREDRPTQRSLPARNSIGFTVDLNACLAANESGAITWNTGEKLAVELQFKNGHGGIASQKFYLVKQ